MAADIDLFCDGHDLPFIDQAFDAVLTTAVLEHVMYPERVASEILRVLKTGGILYSELPFMQVHEGAYDFTRYTLSGHRRLFNRVAEIESGMVAARERPWSGRLRTLSLLLYPDHLCVRYVRGLYGSQLDGSSTLTSYWKIALPQWTGASCTYLLGRKIDGQISDADIIARYVGSKHLRHT